MMVYNDDQTTFSQATTLEAAVDTHQRLSNLHTEQFLLHADGVHRDQSLQTSDHTCNICPNDYCEISTAQGHFSNIFQMLTYEHFQRTKFLSSFYGLKCQIIGVWGEDDDTCASNSKVKLKGLLLKIGLRGLLQLVFPGKSAIIFPELPELTASMKMFYWHVSYALRGVQEKLKYLKVKYCQSVKIQSQKAGKIAHLMTSDAAQKQVMRTSNSVTSTEKDFRKIDMNSCSLNTLTSKKYKNKMIGVEQNNSINELSEKAGLNEQINLGSKDENGNENLIAAYYTPDKARRIPDTGHSSDRAVSSSVGLKGDTEEIPERNESDKHSDKSVPDGDNKDASAALPPHTQETKRCRTPDSSRTQGIQEVPEDVSGRDNREATQKAESYDQTNQECVEGDTDDCCSVSCSEGTGANVAEVGTQKSLQTAGTDSPNVLIEDEDKNKTPKSACESVSCSDIGRLNCSELNIPSTETGTTDIGQSVLQADEEAESTEKGSANESVSETDQMKVDQINDQDDPCPVENNSEETPFSELLTHRTDAGERTMSSETFSSNNDSPPNLMCEYKEVVTSVKQNLSDALRTSPIDQRALEGKEKSPSSQPGVPCPPTLKEQKTAPRVPSLPGQQTPGLDSPLGASERTAEQERLELGKDGLTHWTLRGFRPRDSVKPRPRHSDRPGAEPPTIPADLRQRMQQRNYRIASMLHLGSSLPLGVVELADAGLYYDEDTDEMCCCNCSWRMSRRDFCNFRDPANTHLCSLNTEGDVTTNQGWEADKENDQTARMPEANHQPAEDDDGISSSDVDNYKSRPTSPPDLCLKQRYGTDTASKCDLETDGEKGNEEVAETHTSSLDRGSPVGPTHLRSGLDAASATSEEDRVFESPTWDEHVGSGSGTHGVNAGITQETHDGNDNAMHNIHSAVQNALENNDDAESVTQDAQSDSDTTTLGAQSGGDKFSY